MKCNHDRTEGNSDYERCLDCGAYLKSTLSFEEVGD